MLGVIVMGNNSGIGNQSRRYVNMLKPDRILYIDSTSFSKNKEQHMEWYDSFKGYKVDGFPTNREINVFLKGLTHVLVTENPMNFYMLDACKQAGIKLFIASNYEFCDHLNNRNLTLPYKFLMPSYWHLETMIEKFGADRVMYLPPPTDPNEFAQARETNFARRGDRPKLLHIIGTLAVHDRNGTLDLLEALKYTQSDFELTIRSQHQLPKEYNTNDSRVRFAVEDIKDPQDMYKDFDALILPRRYGGLSLTTNEGLMSGLPIIMPDISPNNKLLPKEWVVQANKKGEFFTRTMIDIYEVKPQDLAQKIDWLLSQDLESIKIQAFDLGHSNFSPAVLRPKYEELFK